LIPTLNQEKGAQMIAPKPCRALPMQAAALFTACLLVVLTLIAMPAQASTPSVWPQTAVSQDGVPIAYEQYGAGEPTLVFVHGWSCDSRYWRAQIDHFAKKYRVVVLDLAGHGHSGLTRNRYTMQAFGQDVRAVVEAVGGKTVILVGHSMGGQVIAEAARLMPDRVIGLIGVDTFDNIEYPLTRKELEQMIAPLVDDFQVGTRAFVEGMIRPDTDPRIRDWILADMSSAPPWVALSALEEMMQQYIAGDAAKIFEQIKAPVVCVSGDLWPINAEANRRHMQSFEAVVVPNADHFLMLDRPYAFNQGLEQAVHTILRKAARQ
jgi:pimeloyl-ACP methyl ester carboxylesterase